MSKIVFFINAFMYIKYSVFVVSFCLSFFIYVSVPVVIKTLLGQHVQKVAVGRTHCLALTGMDYGCAHAYIQIYTPNCLCT